MANKTFFNSMVCKQLPTNAPDFIIAKVGINLETLEAEIDQLKEAGHCDNGWLNIDIKMSRKNSPYPEVDTWKPTKQGQQGKLDLIAQKETLTTRKEAILKAE